MTVSSQATAQHPLNQPFDFTYLCPQTIELPANEEWECGLKQVSFILPDDYLPDPPPAADVEEEEDTDTMAGVERGGADGVGVRQDLKDFATDPNRWNHAWMRGPSYNTPGSSEVQTNIAHQDARILDFHYADQKIRLPVPEAEPDFHDAPELVRYLNYLLSHQEPHYFVRPSDVCQFIYSYRHRKVYVRRTNGQSSVMTVYSTFNKVKILMTDTLSALVGFKFYREWHLLPGRNRGATLEAELDTPAYVPPPSPAPPGKEEEKDIGLGVHVFMDKYLQKSYLHNEIRPLLYLGDYQSAQKVERIDYIPLHARGFSELSFFIRNGQGHLPFIRDPDTSKFTQKLTKTLLTLHFRRKKWI